MGKSSVEVNQGNLRSVNVAQSGERTRLVLNLKQPANYRAEIQGKVWSSARQFVAGRRAEFRSANDAIC